MAVLEKIRNNAGLVVGIVGLGLFAFVVGDALQSGSTFWGQSELTVLSIDGEEVSYLDYHKRIEQMSEMQGAQITDEQRMMINNQLAQEYITGHALEKLSEQVGLQVTPSEVYALLHGNQGIQPSRTAMQFFSSLGIDMNNAEAVNNFISQMSDRSISALPAESQGQMRMIQAQWQQLQRTIVSERKQEKLATLLSRTYKVTKLDQDLALAGGSRTVALVRTSAPAISDASQSVTDDEIKAYYDKNKERYRMPVVATEINYISLQVTPSSEDYKVAEDQAGKILAELSGAASTDETERIARANGSTTPNAYLTKSELERLGLSVGEISFVESAQIGGVHNSGLVADKYNLIKLVDKKSGIGSINIRYMMLDSVGSAKADSLQTALRAGADFAKLAGEYSLDPNAKTNGGLLELPNEMGQTEAAITESMADQLASQSGIAFDQLFREPIGSVLVLGEPNSRIIVKSENASAVTDKYRIAVVSVPAEFSQRTYDAKLAILSKILQGGGSFDSMAQQAEKEGFNVSRAEYINTGTALLGRIPGSRSLIHWALNAEAGETTDKVHRIGTDYIAIAQVASQAPKGYAPLAMVKESIKITLESEKRAEALKTSLASKGLATLEAYASEMGTQIDTIVGVNYLVRGREHAAFNGQAMATALGQLSKPFVAGTEVMVVQPVAQEPANAEAADSQSRQQERNVGYQLFSRAFSSLIEGLEVDDRRGKFY